MGPKSNEILAISTWLKLIDSGTSIMTMDSAGRQKGITPQIFDGRGNYIVALKANHESTPTAVIDFVEEHLNHDRAKMRHQ
jgi:predicted transposase YbfD/YdcC